MEEFQKLLDTIKVCTCPGKQEEKKQIDDALISLLRFDRMEMAEVFLPQDISRAWYVNVSKDALEALAPVLLRLDLVILTGEHISDILVLEQNDPSARGRDVERNNTYMKTAEYVLVTTVLPYVDSDQRKSVTATRPLPVLDDHRLAAATSQ